MSKQLKIVKTKHKIAYDPTPKQVEFHRTNDDWTILGGSIGSGKSHAALIESLGLMQGSIEKGNWRALIVRRTFPQLRELFNRAMILFPEIIPGIRVNQANHTFTFGTSRIEFQSCQYDHDVNKFLGGEWNHIFVDELTQFTSSKVWEFLSTRNRNPFKYKNRMIGTTNPCPWVKQLADIDDEGNDNIKIVKIEDNGVLYKRVIRFLQMNTEDNPHLPPDYKALLQAGNLSEHEKKTLLGGKWINPPVEGQIYRQELQDLVDQRRLSSVPYDPSAETYVFQDIGWADYTVMLFVQFVGQEIHIIDFWEGNHTSAKWLISHVKDKPYRINTVYLPHDGNAHEKGSGKSVYDYWAEHFNTECLERLPITEGLERTRIQFPRVWIDNQRCRGLYNRLFNYRRRYNASSQCFGDIEHDDNSHAADCFRYISYISVPSSTRHKPNYMASPFARR